MALARVRVRERERERALNKESLALPCILRPEIDFSFPTWLVPDSVSRRRAEELR